MRGGYALPSLANCRGYSSSTLVFAQGVRRKKRRLEAILGSWVKQRMATARPISSQPRLSASQLRPPLESVTCPFSRTS